MIPREMTQAGMPTTHYGTHSVPGQTLLPSMARMGISILSWPENRPSLGRGVTDDNVGWFVGSTIRRMFVMILDHNGPMLFGGWKSRGGEELGGGA
jgi:hypothetical protein